MDWRDTRIANKTKLPFKYYKHAQGFTGRDRTREMVRVRDKWTCQDCKRKWNKIERRFDIHHLNGLCGLMSRKYDAVSDLSSLEGMTTLCHKCHFNRPEHRCKSEGFKKNLTKS